MPDPAIDIVDVYKPDIPKDVYREQWKVTGSDKGLTNTSNDWY